MKKVLLTAAAIFAFGFANAQDTKFGIKAGVDLATVKVKIPEVSFLGTVISPETTVSDSETGFYAGGFATIGLSDKFAFQPELMFVAIKDFNFISAPLMARYSLTEEFHAMAGPSLNYFLDAEEDQFKVNVDFGASYDVSDNIDINAKYSLGMGDVSVSGIFIGAGYKF